MTISVKLPPNSGQLLITDKFLKTCRCPLFRGFTVYTFYERAYIRSLFVGHGDAETGLEKLQKNLKDPNYANELIQAPTNGLNVN